MPFLSGSVRDEVRKKFNALEKPVTPIVFTRDDTIAIPISPPYQKKRSSRYPIHIQVFVTLSCPYCAPTASLAHKIAFHSDHITADTINAQEFSERARRYNVYSVPRTIINETIQFEGAVTEPIFIEKVLDAAGSE